MIIINNKKRLAIPPLIRPFVYQSVIITTLPKKMYSFLEAPVPFIVGVTSLPADIPSDIIVIDISKRSLKSLNQIPPLPNLPQLYPFLPLYYFIIFILVFILILIFYLIIFIIIIFHITQFT